MHKNFIFDSTDHIPVSNAKKVWKCCGTVNIWQYIWIFLVRRTMKYQVMRVFWQIGENFSTFWAVVVPSWSKIFIQFSRMLKIFIISCAIVSSSCEFFSLCHGIVQNSIHDVPSTIAIRKKCMYIYIAIYTLCAMCGAKKTSKATLLSTCHSLFLSLTFILSLASSLCLSFTCMHVCFMIISMC